MCAAVLRTNLDTRLAWLGKCRSWGDVFGVRFYVAALERTEEQRAKLSMAKDWAAAGGQAQPDGSAQDGADLLQQTQDLAYNPQLRSELWQWRRECAAKVGKPAFAVLNNTTIDTLALTVPHSEAELVTVPRIGPKKAHDFGAEILDICRRHPQSAAAQAHTGGVAGARAPGGLVPCATSSPPRPASSRTARITPAARGELPPVQAPQVITADMLNAEQLATADRALRGENLFITGVAGTGKSFLLRYLVQELEQRHPGCVAITAPTGIAAVNIGGQTLHSFSGIGTGRAPPGITDPDHKRNILRSMVRKSQAASERWRNTRVLIIDEVSMLDPEMFELLDFIGCSLRGNQNDAVGFGGMQLLLCGDFLQLPPVVEQAEEQPDDDALSDDPDASSDDPGAPPETPASFCFEVPTWTRCGLDRGTVILRQPVRQLGDPSFVQLLNAMRMGSCSQEVMEALSSCRVPTAHRPGKPLPSDGIVPTKLYCTNRDVDAENEARLREIPGEPMVFRGTDAFVKMEGKKGDKKALQKLLDNKIPEEITLKVGAQVVLLRKMEQGLVNGSRGVVEGLDYNGVTVRFDNGVLFRVKRTTYRQVGHGGELRRSQVPLKLGWALTMHRAQGMTLTRAEVQLENVFTYGQAYVAISRLRSLSGLWIKGRISPHRIRAHPVALEFYGLPGPET